MKIQLLNSFRGDDIRDIDTETAEGKGTAAKMIADLLRTGSALFLEKEVNGKTYTYRVTGYDEMRDKIKLTLAPDDPEPEDAKPEVKRRGRKPGTPNHAGRYRSVPSGSGQIVSVAPVSGGVDAVEEPALSELTEEQMPSWKALRWGVNKLCEERGWYHGCPMPSAFDQNHRLVVARGAPLHDKSADGTVGFNTEPSSRTCSSTDINEDAIRAVNQWTPTHTRVEIYRDSKGTFKLQWPTAHEKLMFWIDTMAVRSGAMDWDTEIVAMASLQSKISENQWDSYVLNGAFVEFSKRSRVTYILRRGLPTIAMTERPLPNGMTQRHFLAALCLHPMAYYQNTWAGSQPPSDEVIAHLMLIRADEHRFWKKAGQHPITDPRAAI